jgi:hypothetical protein
MSAVATDQRMTLAEFKQEYRDSLQDLAAAVTNRYAEAVLTTEDLPELRRAMEFLRDTLVLGEEKKVDPNAGVPVFNISINGGSVQISQSTAESPAQDATFGAVEFTPSAAMLANLAVNKDLSDEVIDC